VARLLETLVCHFCIEFQHSRVCFSLSRLHPCFQFPNVFQSFQLFLFLILYELHIGIAVDIHIRKGGRVSGVQYGCNVRTAVGPIQVNLECESVSATGSKSTDYIIEKRRNRRITRTPRRWMRRKSETMFSVSKYFV
jgi:hypothetical protein